VGQTRGQCVLWVVSGVFVGWWLWVCPIRFWGSCGVGVGLGGAAGADSPYVHTTRALSPTGWDKPEVSVCCGWGMASSLGGGCGFVPFGSGGLVWGVVVVGVDSPSLPAPPALIPTGWDKPEVSVCCGWGMVLLLGGGCGFVPFGSGAGGWCGCGPVRLFPLRLPWFRLGGTNSKSVCVCCRVGNGAFVGWWLWVCPISALGGLVCVRARTVRLFPLRLLWFRSGGTNPRPVCVACG
jgi:hypothetical protein